MNSKIVVTLVYHKNYMGAAYVERDESSIYLIDDMYEDKNDLEVTMSFLESIKPQQIILASEQDKNMIVSHVNISIQANCEFIVLPKSEYSLFHCLNRIRCLRLENEPKYTNHCERHIYLNSIINFASYCTNYALGLLLIYLDENWNFSKLVKSKPAFYSSLKFRHIDNYVTLSIDTYKELKIISKSKIFSDQKINSDYQNYEEVNLFSLFNNCATRLGEKYLRKIFKQPTRNISHLNERYDFIEFSMEPINNIMINTIKLLLADVITLPVSVFKYSSNLSKKIEEWKSLVKVLKSMKNISNIFKNHQNMPSIFSRISSCMTDEIDFIIFLVDHVINLEVTNCCYGFSIRKGIDFILDKLVSVFHQLPETLSMITPKKLQSLAFDIDNCHLVYIPEIGYEVAVTKWKSKLSNLKNIDNMEYKFTANGVNYFKNSLTYELDETLGDISQKIKKRTSRILIKFSDFIVGYSGTIFKLLQLFAKLDSFISLFCTARKQYYIRPKITKKRLIQIYGGRHPLIEQSTNFIVHDMTSGEYDNLIKVVTGPNNGGKSTYLKQIATIVYMAHIGSYVPANSAVIGLVTVILSQFSTRDSASLESSTFLEDMRQTLDFVIDGNLILFSYQLKTGRAICSYAFSVAESFNFDKKVLEYAKKMKVQLLLDEAPEKPKWMKKKHLSSCQIREIVLSKNIIFLKDLKNTIIQIME